MITETRSTPTKTTPESLIDTQMQDSIQHIRLLASDQSRYDHLASAYSEFALGQAGTYRLPIEEATSVGPQVRVCSKMNTGLTRCSIVRMSDMQAQHYARLRWLDS